MSAPRTNIETQKRRHIGPLIGMALVAVFAVGLILYWQFELAAEGKDPQPEVPASAAPIDPGPAEVIAPGTPGTVAPQPQPQGD
jgi:hypothetical protein